MRKPYEAANPTHAHEPMGAGTDADAMAQAAAARFGVDPAVIKAAILEGEAMKKSRLEGK